MVRILLEYILVVLKCPFYPKSVCSFFVAVQSLVMDIQAVTPVDGNCIAIIDEDQTKLMKYRGCFDKKVQEIQLNNRARNIVAVELAGRSCLAITYK